MTQRLKYFVFVGLTISISEFPAHAFLGDLLKKDDKKVVTAEQQTNRESAAAAALAKAKNYEASGKQRQARDTYKSVAKSYPRTDAAAEAKYNYAKILQSEGNGKKAFEEYQDLITNFPNTPRFNESIANQFAIADHFRNNQKKGFLGVGVAIQPSELVEMFQQISKNAPHSEFAPKSILNIGYVRSKLGENNQAIASFQSVVNGYAGSSYAKEAQYEIFKLRGENAENSNSPVMDREQVEAGLDFVNQNPDDQRAQEIKSNLDEIEERSMEKLYNTGMFYEKSGKLQSAKFYYSEVIKNPNTQWASKAQQRLYAIDNAPEGIDKKAGRFGLNPLKKDKLEMRTSTDEVVPLPAELPAQ